MNNPITTLSRERLEELAKAYHCTDMECQELARALLAVMDAKDKQALIDDRMKEALHTATASIYFNDSSDYLPALWSIVRTLSPEIALLLERDESAAFNQTAELAAMRNRTTPPAHSVPDGWIKCSVDYPKFGEDVLIRIPVCGIFNIESGKYIGDGLFLGAWFDTRGKGRAYDVSHWMPLPAAPGGD